MPDFYSIDILILTFGRGHLDARFEATPLVLRTMTKVASNVPLSSLLLLLATSGCLAPLPPDAPDFCSWLGKEQVRFWSQSCHESRAHMNRGLEQLFSQKGFKTLQQYFME